MDHTCPRSLSEGSDWFMHDLPICNSDCNAPIPCLVTDKCRCATTACGDEPSEVKAGRSQQISDALTYHYGEQLFIGKAAIKDVEKAVKQQNLVEQVGALPWDVVIQPSARDLFSQSLSSLPKGHVLELPHAIDNHMAEPACYDLAKADVPTMADHFLIQGLQQHSPAMDDADFVTIPFYQGCYYNYLKQNTYKKLADTVAHAETQIAFNEKLRASNIVIPFLHDWGSVSDAVVVWWSRADYLYAVHWMVV